MDKIIKYILDRDIKIRALDAKYNSVSLSRPLLRLQGKGGCHSTECCGVKILKNTDKF